MSAFGIVGFALTLAGVFAMTASSIEVRRRELSIRAALGASPDRLLILILTSTVWPLAIGLTVGGLCFAVGADVLRASVLGIASAPWSIYPPVLAAVATCALITSLAATWQIRRWSGATIAATLNS
jgi:ABC-type antimicrobial peptide transport system permease subunit